MSEPSTSTWPAPFEPETSEDMDVHEDVYEILPRERVARLRLVGPGRRERAYLERVAALETEVSRAEALRVAIEARAQSALRELEIVSLLERGAERRLNRSEREVEHSAEEIRRREQRESRLLVALGALQNENQRLAEKLTSLQAADRRALGPQLPRVERSARGWRALVRRWLGD